MFKLVILALFAITAFSSQDTPIPASPDGYSLGSTTPTLHLEGHFDLICPDCKNSWAILEPILRNEYDIVNNKTLRFTIHLFPLTYHVNSFLASQGARVIADNLRDPNDMWTYINMVFANQSQFSNPATFQQTQVQIQANLATLVDHYMPQYSQVFASGLQYGSQADSEARISWKYGCYRGITGTPTFFANGVAIDGAENFSSDDWRNFLNGGYLERMFI